MLTDHDHRNGRNGHTGDRPTRERQPMTWPLAVVGLGVLAFLALVAWLCAGVVTAWIAQ